MTQSEINLAVASAIKLIAANNPSGVTSALRSIGYQTQYDIIPSAQIETALHELYLADKAKFYSVLKRVSWDNATLNWTNDPANKAKLLSSVNIPSTARTGDWWQPWVDALAGSDTTTAVTTAPTPTPVGVYIAFSAIAIAVVVLIVIILKK